MERKEYYFDIRMDIPDLDQKPPQLERVVFEYPQQNIQEKGTDK